MNPRKSVLQLGMGIMISYCAVSVSDTSAQNYPNKPIRMLVGYPAGGGADTLARLITQKFPESLGQTVIVHNLSGAGGSMANERVATASPDGYTLLFLTAAGVSLAALANRLPYDLSRDLTPVSLVASGPYILVVNPAVPARDVKELIALARAQPGGLNFGSSGVGSGNHLAGELFNNLAKVSTVHITYKGASETVIAAASGEIQIYFSTPGSGLPLIKAGKLNALAVSSLKRSSLLPSLPSLDEVGLIGFDRSVWYGVVGPAGLPRNITARLNTLIAQVVQAPEMKETFSRQGVDAMTNTNEQFAAFIKNEMVVNARLVKAAGIKAE